VQSLISWAGMYRGALAGTHKGLEGAKEPHSGECDDQGMGCGCASKLEIEGLEKIVLNEAARVGKIWEQLDAEAGNEAHEIREEALRIYRDEMWIYGAELLQELADQHRAQTLVAQARVGQRYPDELSAPPSAAVAVREVNLNNACAGASPASAQDLGAIAGPLGQGGNGFMNNIAPSKEGISCAPFGQDAHAVWATMGTRGYAFVTARNSDDIVARIMQLMPPGVSVDGDAEGSGFFSTEDSHGEASKTDQQAWAHDHMALTVTYARAKGKCEHVTKGNANVVAYVRSTAKVGDEAHAWVGGTDTNPVQKHTVGGGMWPAFIDYNTQLLVDPNDNYGQPKMYAMMQRDYAVRNSNLPWEQRFGLSFTSGSNTGLDLRGRAVSTSLATGVAYYHRGMHWREPPNFFNPFWRATLSPPDDDVGDRLDAAGYPELKAVYDGLKASGYRGVP
jgi:hypothetical protein